ncbi:MAG: site-specific integrase [Thermodesulfobacteriota bacterium]
MAVNRRNDAWYLFFYPFRGEKKVGLRLDVPTKAEAKMIEQTILKACRSGNYSSLDPASQEALVRMFVNQGWELPGELAPVEKPREELTLWHACELFMRYPSIRDSKSRWRHEIALSHIVERLGRDVPLKSLWVPDLRRYRAEREVEGASSATVGRELSSLSRVYGVMMELQLIDQNPVRLLGGLQTGGKERQAVLSKADVELIASKCPAWFRAMIWTGFYSGMRRGEIMNLSRKQISLSKRMIYLGSEDTKEGAPKRVPIRMELVPILRKALDGNSIHTDKVFLIQDEKGTRPPTLETVKNCWPRACEKLRLEKPWPRFHDLRHSWRACARKSGVDWVIAERILGHSTKKLSVAERYGHISDEQLLKAVDAIDFDVPATEIMVAGRLREGLRGKW